MAAINLLQTDLDKSWNYLYWYVRAPVPPLPPPPFQRAVPRNAPPFRRPWLYVIRILNRKSIVKGLYSLHLSNSNERSAETIARGKACPSCPTKRKSVQKQDSNTKRKIHWKFHYGETNSLLKFKGRCGLWWNNLRICSSSSGANDTWWGPLYFGKWWAWGKCLTSHALNQDFFDRLPRDKFQASNWSSTTVFNVSYACTELTNQLTKIKFWYKDFGHKSNCCQSRGITKTATSSIFYSLYFILL